MTEKQARLLVILFIIIIVLLSCFIVIPEKVEGPPPITWIRSDIRAPPVDEPIIGFWIDGSQPIPVACVCYGGIYFEYNPGSKYPAMLFGYPPVWWIAMPGGAE